MSQNLANPEPAEDAGRTPATIPYPRFAEVVGERNAAKERIEQLSSEVDRLSTEAELLRGTMTEIETKLETVRESQAAAEEAKAELENLVREHLEARLRELQPEEIESLPEGLSDLELLAHLDSRPSAQPARQVKDVSIGAPSRPGPPGLTDEERLARLARAGDRKSLTALIRSKLLGG